MELSRGAKSVVGMSVITSAIVWYIHYSQVPSPQPILPKHLCHQHMSPHKRQVVGLSVLDEVHAGRGAQDVHATSTSTACPACMIVCRESESMAPFQTAERARMRQGVVADLERMQEKQKKQPGLIPGQPAPGK